MMKETSRKLNANIISMAILYEKEIPNEIDLSKIFDQNPIPADSLHFTLNKQKKTVKRKEFWDDVYNKLVWKAEHEKQYQKIWGAQAMSMPMGFGDYQACIIRNKKILKDILLEAYPSTRKRKMLATIEKMKTDGNPKKEINAYHVSETKEIDQLKTDITGFINSTTGSLLFFHFLAGYKNTKIGGTSRPDTGWLAFVQSLFPKYHNQKNTMVIIYSNGVPLNWHDILTDGTNNLWNSVANYTGYVIVDKYLNGWRN